MGTREVVMFDRVMFDQAVALTNIEENTLDFVRRRYLGRCISDMYVVDVALLSDVTKLLYFTDAVMHGTRYKFDVEIKLTGFLLPNDTHLIAGEVTEVRGSPGAELVVAVFKYNSGKFNVCIQARLDNVGPTPKLGSKVSCTVTKVIYSANSPFITVRGNVVKKQEARFHLFSVDDLNPGLVAEVRTLLAKHQGLCATPEYVQKCEIFAATSWAEIPRHIEIKADQLFDILGNSGFKGLLMVAYNPHNVRGLEILWKIAPKMAKKTSDANSVLLQAKLNLINMISFA